MKRLILDHYRRWCLLLIAVAGFTFYHGWQLSARPEAPFEFWVFICSLWTGTILLSFDFARGLTRAVGVVPLTSRQIGRSWWFAAVGIPAVAISGLLILGAGLQVLLNPGGEFPAGRLALASLFAFVWLGTSFIMSCNLPLAESLPRFFGSRAWLNLLAIFVFFGSMAKGINASHDPLKTGLILGLGGYLTLASWYLSGRMILARPSPLQTMRPKGPQLTPLEIKIPAVNYPAANESAMTRNTGGIKYLCYVTFFKAYFFCLFMMVLMALVGIFFGPKDSLRSILDMLAAMGGNASAWIVLLTTILPMLHLIRHLRSLPVPAGTLAAILLIIPTMPQLAIAATLAGVIGMFGGSAAAMMTLKYHVISWIPVPAYICVLVWRGFGIGSILTCLALAILSQIGLLNWHTPISAVAAQLPILAAVYLANLMLGWAILRWVLLCCSRPFRPTLAQNNPYYVFGASNYR